MSCLAEQTWPGVGVYTPAIEQLEANASKLVGMKFQRSIKRLIVHVHQPELLTDALSPDAFIGVEYLEICFWREFSFNGLKAGLEEYMPNDLRELKVKTTEGGVNQWNIDCLRSLFQPLATTKFDILGYWDVPKEPKFRDEIVSDGDRWFRHKDDEVAVVCKHYPFMEDEIKKREPSSLVIDCDDQFHGNWYEGIKSFGGLSDLTLHNVLADSSVLFRFLDGLVVRDLRITSNYPEMKKWKKAVEMRVRMNGGQCLFNCV